MAVPSQLNPGDVKVLRSIKDLVGSQGHYHYLELGSYLGASLQWHLVNPLCDSVLSVDLRSQEKIRDERQIDYRYTTTTQDMLATLKDNNISVDKLICVDGTIDDVKTDQKFSLAFIDAEHTDQAVYHDGIGCLPFLHQNAVLMFHDDWIIYQGIESIEQHLTNTAKQHRKLKIAGSDITVIALGNWRHLLDTHMPGSGSDWGQFRLAAQTKLGRKT